MDWLAVARNLGERTSIPLALLDQSGRIRLFNRAMEAAIGCSRFEAEGQNWQQVFTLSKAEANPLRWISEAMRGALQSYEADVVTAHGRRIQFRFELSVVGRGADEGLLALATRVTPAAIVAPDEGTDFEYDVVTAPSRYGVLLQTTSAGQTVSLPAPTTPCHELLHGRAKPCEDCPLGRVALRDEPFASTVRYRRVGSGPTSRVYLEVLTAQALDEETVRIRVRALNANVLSAIHDAKLREVADRFGLTPREREVMQYLTLGRSIADIAEILQISERTVKFHQANVIDKVGADSRVDLMRLLF